MRGLRAELAAYRASWSWQLAKLTLVAQWLVFVLADVTGQEWIYAVGSIAVAILGMWWYGAVEKTAQSSEYQVYDEWYRKHVLGETS